MENKQFEQQFKVLGLEIKPLPQNYTPDTFAQSLLRDVPPKPAITYSANTNYNIEKANSEKR